MQRREFITLLGSAAAAWPLVARAQQSQRMRRIGVLMQYTENDPDSQARRAGLEADLARLGWMIGRDVAIDYRWNNLTVIRGRRITCACPGCNPGEHLPERAGPFCGHPYRPGRVHVYHVAGCPRLD